jgi:hypothetical protein
MDGLTDIFAEAIDWSDSLKRKKKRCQFCKNTSKREGKG